jgi:hypothetical protein
MTQPRRLHWTADPEPTPAGMQRVRGRIGILGVAVLSITGLAFGGVAWAMPTPVGLGTATNAAVVSGTEPTNSGVTTIIGDVDSSTPATAGFTPCPGANCVVYAPPSTLNANNGVSSGAAADTSTALVHTQGLTPALAITPGLDGQNLVGGLYSVGAPNLANNGVLTLNAAENPGSVWIFQATSTITTGTGSNVVFSNVPAGTSLSELACNVFWTATSSVDLLGTTFIGTVLAQTSITVGAGVTVQGRLLAGTGDVTLINDTIDRPTCAEQAAGTGGTPAGTAGGSGATTGGTGTGGTGTGGTGSTGGGTVATTSTGAATPVTGTPTLTG